MTKYTVVVESNGTSWYKHGTTKLHREGGPAVEYADGSKSWYLNGKLHREGGPAIEWASGTKSWFLNGKHHREGGPAVEYADGTKSWFLNGKCHREGGPAIEWASGTKSWYLNGEQLSESEYKQQTNQKKTSSCHNKVVEIEGKKYRLVEEK